MISIRDLAQQLYEAYSNKTGGKSLATGQELPKWENLPTIIQNAWMASAKKAFEILVD